MIRRLGKLTKNSKGATAVEYGLIISLIVLGLLGALLQFAGVTTNMWNTVANKVTKV